MRFLHLVSGALCLQLHFTGIAGAPVADVSSSPSGGHGGSGKGCSKVHQFKEWRDISKKGRENYLNAVLCLFKLPPKDKTRPEPKSRFEEFQATHIFLRERIHLVGQFLPWHRNMVRLYADALRDECGYNGPMAFWDWTRDADKADVPLKNSPVFDATYGFGGDGTPGTYTVPPDPTGDSEIVPEQFVGCVTDGPFANVKVHLGPGKLLTEHCIVRGINEPFRVNGLSETVRISMESINFEEFRLSVDFMPWGIHGSGHGIVGGEMLNFFSAPADPLFYLHHANIDRIWWNWQKQNFGKRLYDISGPKEKGGFKQVDLDFVMDFPALGPNLTIKDTMDIRKAPGCFTYDY